jgi:DNA primase large subunit
MPTEKIIDLFRASSDFNERMTRYQVEHIAGKRGSMTRYKPPKCDMSKTHGLCVGDDKACRGVTHPLAYYSKAIRQQGKVAKILNVQDDS